MRHDERAARLAFGAGAYARETNQPRTATPFGANELLNKEWLDGWDGMDAGLAIESGEEAADVQEKG